MSRGTIQDGIGLEHGIPPWLVSRSLLLCGERRHGIGSSSDRVNDAMLSGEDQLCWPFTLSAVIFWQSKCKSARICGWMD